ncbi:RidA family protein [Dokdonia sp.]|uniref:RidA family protein n=1 Tax=Dokdonia sp. TaxID=2024995 RepID=UPI0032643391
MMTFEQKAIELGCKIEPAKQVKGKPLKAVRTGNLVYTSGQLSIKNGIDIKGKVGEDLTIAEGQEAARQATLNCLSAIKTVIGSLDKITKIVKVLGMVNVSNDFNDSIYNDTSKVINGCSDLLYEIFGEAGEHARSAVGMTLPRNFAVEIEMIVEVK